MLITPEYCALQNQFHKQCPNYGISGQKWSEQILDLAKRMQTRSILDYGAGKCTLQKAIPFPIQSYDPCIAELSTPPFPADIVVCTDVLEHIEPDCLTDVLLDIQRCTQKVVFFDIATKPASKFLPDGRNAHILLQSSNWWLQTLTQYFTIESMTLTPNTSVVAICTLLEVTNV